MKSRRESSNRQDVRPHSALPRVSKQPARKRRSKSRPRVRSWQRQRCLQLQSTVSVILRATLLLELMQMGEVWLQQRL